MPCRQIVIGSAATCRLRSIAEDATSELSAKTAFGIGPQLWRAFSLGDMGLSGLRCCGDCGLLDGLDLVLEPHNGLAARIELGALGKFALLYFQVKGGIGPAGCCQHAGLAHNFPNHWFAPSELRWT